MAITTFSFNRKIDSANWMVFLLRSLCVYRPVGSELLHITFKIRITCYQYRSTNTSWPSRLSSDFIRRTSGRNVGKLKNRCQISGSFRRNSTFHISVNTRFWDIVQAMRNCRAGKRLFKVLTLHTRIHRCLPPPPPPPRLHFRSVREIAKMWKATLSCIMSIRLSVCPHWTTRPHWADFH